VDLFFQYATTPGDLLFRPSFPDSFRGFSGFDRVSDSSSGCVLAALMLPTVPDAVFLFFSPLQGSRFFWDANPSVFKHRPKLADTSPLY